MITFDEARQFVIKEAKSFGRESVRLDDAVGRVLADLVVADRDYPPFNRAAMDGYAIRQSDWDAGIRSFLIRERIFAGSSHTIQIREGECYQIMTGAAVPEYADVVIRREDVTEHTDIMVCNEIEVKQFQNVAARGGDLKKGQKIFNSPVLCAPSVIAVLAAIGKTEIEVQKLPTITTITTGDEVVNISSAVTDVQIRNSNAHLIRALLRKWNITPLSSVHVPDRSETIELAVKSARNSDVIILCGGVSAGNADFVPDSLNTAGAIKIFHKAAIKPGKPLWFGKFPNGAIVFALPGNPLSCLVTFKLFIELFLCYSFSLGEPAVLKLPLSDIRIKKGNLDEFFPVKIIGSRSSCEIIPFNGSGDITAALNAAGIARHVHMQNEIHPGTIVDVYPLF